MKSCLWDGRRATRDVIENRIDKIYRSISLFENFLSSPESVNKCNSSVKKKFN